MLQSLEILNGEMTPKFDMYNNTYSINVKNDVDFLMINYTADEGYEVEFLNNSNFIEGENIVYIELIKEEDHNIYTLLVNKEKSETVSTIDINYEPVEVVKELPDFVAPLIAVSCFLVILFTFSLLFSKKKVK